MKIFNHTAYEITGKEMDKIFKKCDGCNGENTFPHTCGFYIKLSDISNEEWEKYCGKAWCIKKGEK